MLTSTRGLGCGALDDAEAQTAAGVSVATLHALAARRPLPADSAMSHTSGDGPMNSRTFVLSQPTHKVARRRPVATGEGSGHRPGSRAVWPPVCCPLGRALGMARDGGGASNDHASGSPHVQDRPAALPTGASTCQGR